MALLNINVRRNPLLTVESREHGIACAMNLAPVCRLDNQRLQLAIVAVKDSILVNLDGLPKPCPR